MPLHKKSRLYLIKTIDQNIKNYFSSGNNNSCLKSPYGRYASYDFCYNYFYSFVKQNKIKSMSQKKYMQLSCLHLFCYLSSWGMLRGSSPTQQKSMKFFEGVIKLISKQKPHVWKIDLDNYNKKNNVNHLMKLFKEIKKELKHLKNSDILATKIMLGVFGNIPAFDTNFKRAFGITKPYTTVEGKGSLEKIHSFYNQLKGTINRHKIRTFDFKTGKKSKNLYSKAKILDMVGFIQGAKKGIKSLKNYLNKCNQTRNN